jgi:PAS domain S-box-containing protein
MSPPATSDSGSDNNLEALWQRVSLSSRGEIVADQLLDALMRAAIEYAGAERSVLVLARREEYWIEAEATSTGGTVSVNLRKAKMTAEDLPDSVLRYAIQTKDSVHLHDAVETNPFSADGYMRARQPRSLLCLPLHNQAGLIGIIYFESNLTSSALAPARIAVIKLLATEAAMSLENIHLYSNLREQDTKTRRIIESALDAVLSMDERGKVTEWNAQAEAMFGQQRDEAVGRPLAELLIPQRYRDAHDKGLQHFLRTREGPLLNRRIEVTALRRDGTEFPVEVSIAPYQIDGRWEFSGFVRDITEKKMAEASTRRHREMEMELAHANRVATMGQLSASIAHEVNQPIGAAVTNAHAALRWLGATPPNTTEVRQALSRIVSNGNRATDVLSRIRAFIKKAPPRKDSTRRSEEAQGRCPDATRGRSAEASRRPSSATASSPQSDNQRCRGIVCFGHRLAMVTDQQRQVGAKRCICRGPGFWPGLSRSKWRSNIPSLLHDQASWAGHGLVDLSIDCGGARWSIACHSGASHGRHFHFYLACASERCIVTVRPTA